MANIWGCGAILASEFGLKETWMPPGRRYIAPLLPATFRPPIIETEPAIGSSCNLPLAVDCTNMGNNNEQIEKIDRKLRRKFPQIPLPDTTDGSGKERAWAVFIGLDLDSYNGPIEVTQ